ncbi:MAG: thioredoxin-disulfide reductase [Candidatus Nitrosothermus koennekii]|nr:MAG: thioredoxin-disulfide reductase [Candidatus Nitrosothermus koennekii]
MMVTDVKKDEVKDKSNKYDVIILGSGPAGLTAAIYTSRARLKTLVLTGNLPGGQLMTTSEVENFPGFPKGIFGPELMMNMREQAGRFGANIVDDSATQVDFKHKPFRILTIDNEYETNAVIVATGASPRKLGVKGEEELGGRGVSYCATCDGPFFKDQDLIVVGGGDSAMEEAIFLTKFAKSVKVVHRRDKLRASKILQDHAMSNPKIQFVWNTVVKEINGNNKVESVILKNLKNDQEEEVRCGGVFIAIGHEPNTSIFKGQLDMDEQGYIKVTDYTKTNIEGVFAAGDVHDNRYRQAVTAAGLGCMAALDAEKYLQEKYNI